MSHRRHHNNTGLRQIRRGKTREQVRRIAERLGIPYASDDRVLNAGVQTSRVNVMGDHGDSLSLPGHQH